MGRRSKQVQKRRAQRENNDFDAIESELDNQKLVPNEPKKISANPAKLSKKQKKKKNRYQKPLAVNQAVVDVMMDEVTNAKQEK